MGDYIVNACQGTSFDANIVLINFPANYTGDTQVLTGVIPELIAIQWFPSAGNLTVYISFYPPQIISFYPSGGEPKLIGENTQGNINARINQICGQQVNTNFSQKIKFILNGNGYEVLVGRTVEGDRLIASIKINRSKSPIVSG